MPSPLRSLHTYNNPISSVTPYTVIPSTLPDNNYTPSPTHLLPKSESTFRQHSCQIPRDRHVKVMDLECHFGEGMEGPGAELGGAELGDADVGGLRDEFVAP